VNTAGLYHNGRGRTKRPRVYVGCLPSAQGHWAADLAHANRWIENHWRRCRGPLSHGRSKTSVSLSETRKVTA
jgi:hypothetical protein